jgi:predicted DNA-binding transcriptional regulator AlpA
MSAARSFVSTHMFPGRLPQPVRSFVSEIELEQLTDISRRTWQKHRLLGTGPKYYKIGGAVRYALDEVMEYIQASAVEPGPR